MYEAGLDVTLARQRHVTGVTTPGEEGTLCPAAAIAQRAVPSSSERTEWVQSAGADRPASSGCLLRQHSGAAPQSGPDYLEPGDRRLRSDPDWAELTEQFGAHAMRSRAPQQIGSVRSVPLNVRVAFTGILVTTELQLYWL